MRKIIPGRTSWLTCAAAAALIAALLRIWQLNTAFEGAPALPIPGAPASVILVCVLVIAGACLLLLAAHQPLTRRSQAGGKSRRWDLALLAPEDKVYPTLLVAAGFLALAAVPNLLSRGFAQFRLYQASLAGSVQTTNNGVLTLATALAALLAFFGLVQMGRESFHPGRRGMGSFSAALPGAASCVWLMEHFRASASDPVLWNYVPELLAIVLGMFFYLDSAAMSGEAARPRCLLWLAGMTVVFSAVAAVSRPPAGDILLLCSQSLAALGTLWQLPPNLGKPPARNHVPRDWRVQVQEQEKQEEPSHE